MPYRGHDSNQVSTRAPAKGATRANSPKCGGGRVSTRAPAKGATVSIQVIFAVLRRFNSRSREGNDRMRKPTKTS